MARRQRVLMDRAYGQIRQRFMTLELRPGDWVDDLKLSEELGLSRTPVREALFLLASEGLVLVLPGGGFAVRSLDLVDISRLFEAHVVAAKAIARLTALRATKSDLKRLRSAEAAVTRAIERRNAAEIAASNGELHRLEAEIAQNEYLERLACRIHDQGQRLGYLAFGGADDWSRLSEHFALVQKDHADVMAAYEAKDPDAAEVVATRHVDLFRQRILRFFAASEADAIDLSGDVLSAVASDRSDVAAPKGGRPRRKATSTRKLA
jgi:DNA-binding GntR family transcriptional regulator